MAHFKHARNALQQIIRNSDSRNADRLINPLLYACQGVRYRKLEVILTKSIDKLGKAGETVKVAPGHFRNHLMPKLLAVPNLPKFAFLIKEQQKLYQPEEEEVVKVVKDTKEDKTKEFQAAAKRLDNARLVLREFINKEHFHSRATKDEPIELREPVTKEKIVAEVARQLCIQISPENLQLTSPISTFGEYEVPLRLPKTIPLPEGKVQWTLNVKVRCK